jgi:ketosteroid isomerase-like protein
MKTSIPCLFLLLSTMGFAQAPDGAVDPLTPAIDRLREGLVESFQKGDIDSLLTHLDPEVVVTWQNGEVCRGKEEVRAFYERMMNGEKRVVRDIKSKPEILGRHVNGDWAVSWGNLHDHFVLMDGSDLPFNSVFTATIVKRGDRWLVTAFHTSVSVFDNPVLETAVAKIGLWIGLGGGLGGLLVGFLVSRVWRRKSSAK